MNEIETYISFFPDEVQLRLNQIRSLIFDIAPEADEQFAYGMPAYKTHKKPLVYYAAFKNHIGLYATPSGHSEFAPALAGYKQGKGSVQFPHNEPLPVELIGKIIKFRVEENELLKSSK
jgi:uncharacterized protein YdhG (YjbR/CyaY superfamily)